MPCFRVPSLFLRTIENFYPSKSRTRDVDGDRARKVRLRDIFNSRDYSENASGTRCSKIMTESEKCFSSTKSLYLCEVHSGEMGESCQMKFCNRIMWVLVRSRSEAYVGQYDVSRVDNYIVLLFQWIIFVTR